MRFSFLRSFAFPAVVATAALVTHSAFAADKHPIAYGCQVQPQTVHPGELVTVTGSALYLNPKRETDYFWQSTGGKLASDREKTTVNTTYLAPGEYTVSGRVTQGQKPMEQAGCTARFRVIPFEPPSISCKTSPITGNTGTTFDVMAMAVSAQNRPLTYSFSSSAGRLTTAGPNAKLNTKDVPAGIIKVSCYVVDDRGLSASALTQIQLGKPALQPVSTGSRRLCSLNFGRDKQHPVRVDASAEGCLDNIAFAMKQSPGSRVVFVGNASPDEAPENSAERGLNARQYLVAVRGISMSQIQVLTGETSGPTVDATLVPAGASFSQVNTAPFDETAIVRHGPPYVPPATPPSYKH